MTVQGTVLLAIIIKFSSKVVCRLSVYEYFSYFLVIFRIHNTGYIVVTVINEAYFPIILNVPVAVQLYGYVKLLI